MLFSSPVYSQASGSVAGLVYSHNRGGMYTRSRATPTNPGTALQGAVRDAMSALAPYWSASLSQAQRDAWNLYAANVSMINKLGASVYLTGQQHFIRSNVTRLQCGLDIVELGPSIYDLGTFTTPSIANISPAPGAEVAVAYEATDAWATTVGGFLAAYFGKPQNAGVSFYKGPFRLCGVAEGAAVAPASPLIGSEVFPIVADNVAWVQVRIGQADGRLSGPILLGPETIA